MCRGTTRICRTCGRSDTRYTERCSQDIVNQDETRGIQHRIFGRILLTRQCRQCREAERRRATIEANEIGRQMPRAKHLLEFLRGEQLQPVREAELELTYQVAYLDRERLHPYVDGSSRVTEIREGLTGYPEGLQHFNDAIARQAEIDRERRQIAIADLPLRLDLRRLHRITPIGLARRLADMQEEDLAERGWPDEDREPEQNPQAPEQTDRQQLIAFHISRSHRLFELARQDHQQQQAYRDHLAPALEELVHWQQGGDMLEGRLRFVESAIRGAFNHYRTLTLRRLQNVVQQPEPTPQEIIEASIQALTGLMNLAVAQGHFLIIHRAAPILVEVNDWRDRGHNPTEDEILRIQTIIDSVTGQNEGPLVADPNLPEQNQPPARPNTPEPGHTPYDPVEERRREENRMLRDAAVFANRLEELYQGIPASEARNTGLRAIRQAQDFLDEFFVQGARLPSAEQWWWILSTNQRIEAVLHGELSIDDLDNGAPPANEGDIIGQFERERNRIQRRAAERTERLRSNLRPRTPDPDSQVSDEEDMNEGW